MLFFYHYGGFKMGTTTILEETHEKFDTETGEITAYSKQRIRKTKVEPTDEFVKVSRYLNVVFAYNSIPLNLVPISLLLAQRMEYKTNVVYLLKGDKEEISEMLGVTYDRVNHLVQDLKKYDIIRPTNTRGKFAVNAYLFSTGSMVETRNLQAHFNFEHDVYLVQADHKNLITGETIRKSVYNNEKAKALKGQIPGQLSLEDLSMGE